LFSSNFAYSKRTNMKLCFLTLKKNLPCDSQICFNHFQIIRRFSSKLSRWWFSKFMEESSFSIFWNVYHYLKKFPRSKKIVFKKFHKLGLIPNLSYPSFRSKPMLAWKNNEMHLHVLQCSFHATQIVKSFPK
jgi:hypothetical protein